MFFSLRWLGYTQGIPCVNQGIGKSPEGKPPKIALAGGEHKGFVPGSQRLAEGGRGRVARMDGSGYIARLH